MKKYIVYGGYIISKYDKKEHYIPPRKVAQLFKVKLKECILVRNANELKGLVGKYIVLKPQNNGKYDLNLLKTEDQ